MARLEGSAEDGIWARPGAALSVAALVDLEFSESAGGHVKCWQRIAEAAARIDSGLDFTAYFLGKSEQVIKIGENARLIVLPAVLSTRRRIGGTARHTIEARWPTWRDVVAIDLLPIWREAAPRAAASDPAGLLAPPVRWPAE